LANCGHAQIVGRYWGIGRLQLKNNNTYAYSTGVCMAYYGEGGQYYVSKDTITFLTKDSCCIMCYTVDSTSYHLNLDNIFEMKFHKVEHCIKTWNEYDQLPKVVYYSNGCLYRYKSATRPYFNKKDLIFDSTQSEVPDFKKLESDALLKLLFQEFNY